MSCRHGKLDGCAVCEEIASLRADLAAARAEVERLRKDAPCHWTQDDEGNYWTDCGQGHTFIDGGPTENSMKYCCYCGKTLESAKEPS